MADGVQKGGCFDQLSYLAHVKVLITSPRWTKDMNDISQFLKGKKVLVTYSYNPGQNRVLQPEQKRVVWIKDLLRNFTEARDLAADTCACFPRKKAFILLPSRFQSVEKNVSRSHFDVSLTRVLEVFAMEVLNEDSSIKGEE